MTVLSVHISRTQEILHPTSENCLGKIGICLSPIRSNSKKSIKSNPKMRSTAAIFVLVLATASAVELPSSFRICKRGGPKYSECVADSVRDVIISLAGGLKSFKILPIEPLAVDVIKIGESQGAVTLKQEYRNIKVHGLSKGLEIKNYQIDFDKWILQSDAYNPQVDFVADYKVNGRVLVLPVRGAGKCNITMYNLKTRSTIYAEPYEKEGETYLRVKKYVVKFEPERVSMGFDNLFDGDSLLGDQMNRFLNENSDLVFKELQPPYEETFGLVFTKVANDIFSRVPLKKIFPE